MIVYLYDAEGSPIGMQYRMGNENAGVFEEYWFEKNLQGDIVAVYDGEGTKLISYTYDAWGNFITTYHNGCTSSHHANLNPFRYRGYYYDAQLGMYYLQSRYYDPGIGRFINADVYVSTGQGVLGNNMFAYCNNNPINYFDHTGEVAIVDDLLIGGVIIISFVAVTEFALITFSTATDVIDNGISSLNLPSNLHLSKGGYQNWKNNKLKDWTDEEIDAALRGKGLSKKERQELVTEQKSRGTRNRRKRKEQQHSMTSNAYEVVFESLQIFTSQMVMEVLKIVLRW